MRGSVRIDAEPRGGLIITSRTYNLGPNGTFGQGIAAVDREEALTSGGGTLRLIALTNSPRYRTNVGITELLGEPATVGITLYDQFGGEVLGFRRVTVPAFGHFQENVFESMGLGGSAVFAATAVIQVSDGAGGVTAYASTVDNTTGDATTMSPPVRVALGEPIETQGNDEGPLP
jgi:hypothetical protein